MSEDSEPDSTPLVEAVHWLLSGDMAELWDEEGEHENRFLTSGPGLFTEEDCDDCEAEGKSRLAWCRICSRAELPMTGSSLRFRNLSITPWSNLSEWPVR